MTTCFSSKMKRNSLVYYLSSNIKLFIIYHDLNYLKAALALIYIACASNSATTKEVKFGLTKHAPAHKHLFLAAPSTSCWPHLIGSPVELKQLIG